MPCNAPVLNDVTQVRGLPFGLLLWALGMLGVIAITVTELSRLAQLPGVTPPASLWALTLASLPKRGASWDRRLPGVAPSQPYGMNRNS